MPAGEMEKSNMKTENIIGSHEFKRAQRRSALNDREGQCITQRHVERECACKTERETETNDVDVRSVPNRRRQCCREGNKIINEWKSIRIYNERL